jgi:S1-C subfamily serine protease
MKITRLFLGAAAGLLLLTPHRGAAADAPFDKVATDVNTKMVKLFGSGGFKGLTSYGTGIIVSPQGHILTVANPLLDTQDLRVHTSDGLRYRAKVLFTEPELDAALLQIKVDEKEGPADLNLSYFDIPAAAKALKAQPGDWVLAFGNAFQIATRDEPMTVQRGVIAAVNKLVARRGITEAPYHGDVFYLDAITNNPGSAGGAVTTRKGELIGMVGKEFRNVTSDTWINYAIPVNARMEVKDGDKTRILSLEELVTEGIKGTYKKHVKEKGPEGPGAYHGIVFVPNILPQTPPYVDRVLAGSPAAKAKLQPDDLVVYVDGEPVYSVHAFKEMVTRLRPGAKIQLEVRRGEKLTAVEMELTDFPKQ